MRIMRFFLLIVSFAVTLIASSCKKNELSNNDGKSDNDGQIENDDKLKECFYFEAEVNSVEISIDINRQDESYDGASLNISLEYSTDKSNWLPFEVGKTKVSITDVGNRVYVRAKGTNDKFCNYQNGLISYKFSASGNVKIGGNIMYLLNGTGTKTDFDTVTNKWAFSYLFDNMSHLTDASDLVLCANTLPYSCYNSMFEGCKSLKAAPSLPALILGVAC